MFYESLIILNISTHNFSEGVPASVVRASHSLQLIKPIIDLVAMYSHLFNKRAVANNV